MNKQLQGSKKSVSFVEENFSDFGFPQKQHFVDRCDENSKNQIQAMWVIIQQPSTGPSEETRMFDCPAESKEDAHDKLRAFQEKVGVDYKCVVQKMLRIESENQVVRTA